VLFRSIVVRRVSPRSLAWVLLCGIGLAPALRIGLLRFGVPTAGFMGYVLSPCRGDALLAGALGAYAVRQPRLLGILRGHGRRLHAALAVLIAGAVWLTFESPEFDSVGMNTWGRTWLALLCLTLVITSFVHDDGLFARALRNPTLRWLGVRSYAIYLFHLPAVGLLHSCLLHRPARIGNPQGAAVTLLALGLTLALADISYRRLERPFLDRGQTYRY
jgi:peptidoglycan/LPS O-acetylase OafA/YrhL